MVHLNAAVQSSGAGDARVLLIVPAYNEEDSILTVSAAIDRAGYDYIVVNDGSTDGTLALCRAHDIPVLDLGTNHGIGGAVRAGHIYARDNGYDIDIQFDGDGQHDIVSVPDLVDAIRQGADLAVGSRFVGGDGGNFQSTVLRRVGIHWLSFMIKLATGQRVRDVTSGYRACSRRTIELFCEKYPADYPEPISIVTAIAQGFRVQEVPAKMRERLQGKSSISGFSTLRYMVKVTYTIIRQGRALARKNHS